MKALQPAFTVSEALREGWSITKRHWAEYTVLFLGIAVGYAVLFGVVVFVEMALRMPPYFMSLVFMLFGVYASMMMTKASLLLARDRKFTFTAVTNFDGVQYINTLVSGWLFGMLKFIGFLLFIIPGIVASVQFPFYIYSIIDQKTSFVQALEDSSRMTSGNKWKILAFHLLLGGGSATTLFFPAMAVSFATAAALESAPVGMTVALTMFFILLIAAMFLMVTCLFWMISLSGLAYMYLKMRVKTPVLKS